MQQSHNNENLNSQQESSPLKRNREKSQASGTQKEKRKQGAEKESGSSSFPPPSQLCHIHLPLKIERLLPVLFGESVTLRILQKNLSHLHTKQSLL